MEYCTLCNASLRKRFYFMFVTQFRSYVFQLIMPVAVFSSSSFHFFYSSNHCDGFSIDVEFFASAYRIFNSQFRLNISQFTGIFLYECRTHK